MKIKKSLIVRFVLTSIVVVCIIAGTASFGFAALIQPLNYESLQREDEWLKVYVANEPIYFILVEKDRQMLQVLKYSEKLETIKEYTCATGENDGRKEVKGDAKTPEGIYFITKIFTDNKITIFGNRAFHLDYPNFFDKKAGRNGDGIYIHGTNKALKPNSTNGCITMHNSDLDDLVRFLHKDSTPVIIVPNKEVLKKVKTGFLAERGSLATSLVLPEEMELEKINFDYLYLLNDGIQTVAVGEFIHQENKYTSVNGYSRSYLDFSPDRGWFSQERIWSTTPVNIEPYPLKVKIASIEDSSRLVIYPQYPKDERSILEFVENWRSAWQEKDINAYIASYAEDFHKGKMNLTGWRRYKQRLNKKYRKISVQLSNISINWDEEGPQVRFRQVYRSDQFQAAGTKELHLIFKDNEWAIKRELWFN